MTAFWFFNVLYTFQIFFGGGGGIFLLPEKTLLRSALNTRACVLFCLSVFFLNIATEKVAALELTETWSTQCSKDLRGTSDQQECGTAACACIHSCADGSLARVLNSYVCQHEYRRCQGWSRYFCLKYVVNITILSGSRDAAIGLVLLFTCFFYSGTNGDVYLIAFL